jgi:L-histidine N-alpha-methyltransferase
MDEERRFELIRATPDDHLAEFAHDVREGLTASPKHLPCRYFYDREGSLLFEAICALPEYYLTRAERAILEAHAGEILARGFGERVSDPITLVELGSGSATKTRLLIAALLRRQGALLYVPVDISREMLEESARGLVRDYPGLRVRAIAGDYADGLEHLTSLRGRKLILWLGSNIGNLERAEAIAFLRRVRERMSEADAMLIGIDLRKDRAVVERAYNDARGVTARFNANLLARINRELGGHFDLAAFRHHALYNEAEGRIEMYLVSVRAQRVRIERLDLEVSFAAGERIHTENSYKYSPEEITAVARAAGLRLLGHWRDPDALFSVNLFGRAP